MIFTRTLAAALFFTLVSASSFAQGRRAAPSPHLSAPHTPAPAPLEEWTHLSPAERQKALSKLDPDRREKVARQLELYDRLTPDQRRQLAWFSRLSPDRQHAVRDAYTHFQKLPADRQEALRAELSRLRDLSPAERKSSLSNPETRSAFNKKEQKILSDMSDGIPPRD